MITSGLKREVKSMVKELMRNRKSFTLLELQSEIEDLVWEMFNNEELRGYRRDPVMLPDAVTTSWCYTALPTIKADRRGRLCIPAHIARLAELTPGRTAWIYADPSNQEIGVASEENKPLDGEPSCLHTVDKHTNIRLTSHIRDLANISLGEEFYVFMRSGRVVVKPLGTS